MLDGHVWWGCWEHTGTRSARQQRRLGGNTNTRSDMSMKTALHAWSADPRPSTAPGHNAKPAASVRSSLTSHRPFASLLTLPAACSGATVNSTLHSSGARGVVICVCGYENGPASVGCGEAAAFMGFGLPPTSTATHGSRRQRVCELREIDTAAAMTGTVEAL